MTIYKWLNKEKARYYTVSVQKEKSNIVNLNYTWGGCNSNRGGNKILSVPKEELSNLITSLMKRRKTRGYELIEPLCL